MRQRVGGKQTALHYIAHYCGSGEHHSTSPHITVAPVKVFDHRETAVLTLGFRPCLKSNGIGFDLLMVEETVAPADSDVASQSYDESNGSDLFNVSWNRSGSGIFRFGK
jgi:hypothetical protein